MLEVKYKLLETNKNNSFFKGGGVNFSRKVYKGQVETQTDKWNQLQQGRINETNYNRDG